MHESASGTSFGEAFERVVHAIPHEPEFRAIEIVTAAVRPGRTSALTVMVDREGGVDIVTCERIAARINVALDAFPDEYTLEVSSAGVDRPLVKPADYDRFDGRNAKVITTQPIGNAKTHRGILAGVRGTDVILRTGAKGETELPIPIAAIKSANLEYDIRADLQRAKREKQSKA
jgi:ribosome maturation factor RimP